MPSLSKENRKLLENTVAAARVIAVKGATTVLRDQYAVGESAPWPHMSDLENKLRVKLRAHGRQLGDRLGPRDTQELDRLAQACAYEHWHRMLFARFLAENDLLLDPDHGVAMTLEEIRELAQEHHRDWQELAAELAQRMLLAVFRPEDPVLSITLPPETRLQLEEKLALLPVEVFLADDSLGWVYQFWQRDEKDRVNKSEVKIGADELPAVTQLFTEDYMVLFLLENTLGAWWTAERRAEDKDPALPGYTFNYLRLNGDGSPAAGSFDGWPRTAKELRVLDPCMGSGHFLTFALPILARMRMEEEGLALNEALSAVLKDNLFGLELDARCAQIAAFNLALAAWRMAGEHFALPELNLACCGIGPNTTKEQWVKLGEEIAARGGMPANTNLFGSEDSLLSEPVKRTMESLHELFSQAPVLGSLIDPSTLRVDLFQSDYKAVAPLLAAVIRAQHSTEETRERVIAAAGMVKAAELLVGKYTLVVTNVPFLGRGRQSTEIHRFSNDHFKDAADDLAQVFFARCLRLLLPGASAALIAPQKWTYAPRYKHYRLRFLGETQLQLVVPFGAGAFREISGEVVDPGAFIATNLVPKPGQRFVYFEATASKEPDDKAIMLRTQATLHLEQASVRKNPEAIIRPPFVSAVPLLSQFAFSVSGLKSGDSDRFNRLFWEVPHLSSEWEVLQGAAEDSGAYEGLTSIILWEQGRGELAQLAQKMKGLNHVVQNWRRGQDAWGHQGVAISATGRLRASRYVGDRFDSAVTVIVPRNSDHLELIWHFCKSSQFSKSIKQINNKLSVTTATLLNVPFDLAYWQEIATSEAAQVTPAPSATQWLFNGHPRQAQFPLQVAVARLVGYQWPRQTGSTFTQFAALSPDGLQELSAFDGVVPLVSVAGEASAADRLRALLAEAYGEQWSAAKLADLLGDNNSLETWLRDSFFEEHCNLFKRKEPRPFVWHIWDGRKDGFHALLNYHKLAAPNGEGRKTLEKLIYATLGDWITRQRADVAAGVDGADGRLAAAEHLRDQLERILNGEKPYDIFVRWKPLDQQPVGWEPDINDGVRVNIRPWLVATTHQSSRRDASILRITPKINHGKDSGKEQQREKDDFPWFWTWDEKSEDFAGGAEFDGARWNDPHYSLQAKIEARNRKLEEQKRLEQASPARIGAAK